MPNITVSGVDASGGGYNMGTWNGSLIFAPVLNAAPFSSSSSLVRYAASPSSLDIVGTFTAFNQFGDPTQGTITGFTYSSTFGGLTRTMTITSLNMSVSSFMGWVTSGNVSAFEMALFGGADTFTGTSGADALNGYGGNDTLNGGDGDDTLNGQEGSDTVNGEGGNDVIDLGAGNDTLNGGAGNDRFVNNSGLSDTGVDTIDGGDGVDMVTIVRVDGGAVNFSTIPMATSTGITLPNGTVIRNVEVVELWTGAGNDTLTVGVNGGSFRAGDGFDTLIADMSASIYDTTLTPGGPSTIGVFAGYAIESVERFDISTGSGNDYLIGGAYNDVFNSGGGNDVIEGNGGNDTINAGAGNDTINGGDGVNIISGGDGDDTVLGVSPGDQIDGGAGRDLIYVSLMDLGPVNFSLTGLAAGLTLPGGISLQGFETVNLHTGNGNDVLDITGGQGTGGAFYAGGGTDRVVGDFSSLATGLTLNSFGTLTMTGFSFSFSDVEEIQIAGGSATDDLNGGAGDNVLRGNGGNDFLTGGAGDDELYGGSDNDVLLGKGGTNILVGDDGNDDIQSEGVGDTIDGGDGVDRAIIIRSASSVNFVVDTGALTSASWTALADGTQVRNVESFVILTGTGNDVFNITQLTGTGNTINGGDGIDTINVDFTNSLVNVGLFASTIGTGAGASLTFSGIENINFTGSAFAEHINGGDGNDTLNGGGGGDYISGGAGINTLNGGDDNDTISSFGRDVVDGGAGLDFLFLDRSGYGIGLDLYYSAMASAGGQTLADGTIVRNVELFRIYGSATNDRFTVNASLAGENAFHGFQGNDELVGDFSSLAVSLNLYNGFLTPYNSTFRLEITGVERITLQLGSEGDTINGNYGAAHTLYGNQGNDQLIGANLSDTLNGGDGNDVLDGQGGADTMLGGDGDDTYIVDDAGDVTSEVSALGGVDNVQSSVTRTLTANIENLLLTGDAAINGSGNALNNVITGNGAANTLFGFDGNDMLIGGAGADQMFGGLGDDIYYVDNAGDVTSEASALGGVDIVYSSVNRQLTANIENLTLTGAAAIGYGNIIANVIVGNASANTLYGFEGNDRLDGGAGIDTMFGASGDDTYIVDHVNDITVEGIAGAAGGVDTIESSVDRGLNANIENLILGGTAAIGYGNVLDNVMTGNASANSLFGFDGNDTLNGGAGADAMYGGNGNDTYYVDNAGDVTSETSAAGGVDTVICSVARTLTANIENLTLTGGANITGSGNGLNNILIGNAGNNTLYGLDGADTLDGGLGADTLQGGAGADTYVFSTALGGGNVDVIFGYNTADDTIRLSSAVFTGLNLGELNASAYRIGAAAADADDRIIYNNVTGELYFDADGNGAGAAVLFATISAGLNLTSADFIVGGP